MLAYYLFLAWKSIRRTPGNSLIVVAGIALGVAVSTLFSAIYYTYARDPIPRKSGSLYRVRMDSWGPDKAHPLGIPPNFTFRDAIALTKSNIPTRQTGSYDSRLTIAMPSRPEQVRAEPVRLCQADFFTMFGVPFRYGSAWTREADENDEPVVVIDDELNQRFFGGRNSVGELVTIEERPFRIIGVLERWQPPIRYYDFYSEGRVRLEVPIEKFFMPLRHGRALGARFGQGYTFRWRPDPQPGFEGYYHDESTLAFVDVWVELHSPAQVVAYKAFVDGYALEQRRLGRYLRPFDNRVTPLLEYMKECNCPPPEATAMMLIANLILMACALTLIGLLLARFLARSAESSVRRALGASRRDIFVQHLLECQVIALGGGIVGLGLATTFLHAVNVHYRSLHGYDIFHVDGAMIAIALLVTIVAGVVAGAYPAYRACRLVPALHLKRQ
jgi:putative ABC transport system permease protein